MSTSLSVTFYRKKDELYQRFLSLAIALQESDIDPDQCPKELIEFCKGENPLFLKDVEDCLLESLEIDASHVMNTSNAYCFDFDVSDIPKGVSRIKVEIS